MDDKTTSIPLEDSDSKEYEFRIFFPLIKVEDLDINATSDKHLAYAEGLKALEDEFNGVDASSSKDGGNCVKMVYVIGCDHWGAKFRGEKQKLEVKYRTDMTPLGFTHLACEDNSHLACGILERFKKKEYGKKNMSELIPKVLEKIHKHCAREHTADLAVVSENALRDQRLCIMRKWRKHGLNTHEVMTDGCSSCIVSGRSAMVEYAYLEVEGVDMLSLPSYTSAEEPTETVVSPCMLEKTSSLQKWVSICVEGRRADIKHCVLTSFGRVATALRAGLVAGVRMLIAGYPTFVVNQRYAAIVAAATSKEVVQCSPEDLAQAHEILEKRQRSQTQQIEEFLLFMDAEGQNPGSPLITCD